MNTSLPLAVLLSGETLQTALSVACWTFFGIFLCVAGVKLIDWLTPGKLIDQVFKEKNTAAAIVYAAGFVAIAIIIVGAMH
jgi:uncharacterized membrane protein YjfL (UPF0719 family)